MESKNVWEGGRERVCECSMRERGREGKIEREEGERECVREGERVCERGREGKIE